RRGAVGRGGDHGSGLARQGAICPGSRAALTPARAAAIARRVITVGEALATVCAAAPVLGDERVLLAEALGRVAAADVVSARAVPAAPNSAMDGFAVRHADLASVPVRLRVAAVEPAGSVVDTPVAPGTVVKLFTGSVIPPGADTVVKVEDTEERDGWVMVRAAPAPGANVRPAGEDIRPGQVVVAAGTAIGPADLGVLASVGCATLVVHRRPRVAILPTGAELVEVGEPPGRGQVVNSNAYSLAAAAREAGAEPLVLPIARDRAADIRAGLARARKAKGLTGFLRGRLEERGDGPVATALAAQGSGVLSALASGAALLVGPPELTELPAGGRFPVIVLVEATLAREAPPF